MSYIGYIGTPRAMDYQRITAPSPEDYFLNPNMPPNCEGTFRNDMCGTIYEGDYRPQLSLPSQLIDLDPAWKNCEPHIRGIYDPPKALQPATTLDGPEFASALPTTTSAKQANPTTAIDAPSSGETSAQGQPTSQVKPTANTSGPDEPNTPSTVKETRGPAPSSDGGPASDETSAQHQSTSQVKPTTNTSGLDGPETPSTIKETGGLAPSSNGGESGQDSETPVASKPSAIDEASPITTDAPISTPDETFATSPGTAADAEPSSSPTVDSPTTSPATDPSTSPSQNLAETSPEAAPSSANEAPSTTSENALSVLSAAQATYTTQDPATAEISKSASAANTVITQTTVQTGATEAVQGNIPSIGETRTFPIQAAGSPFTATQLVDPTGATQVQVAGTTLSVGGSPASIGDGNQVSAASGGIVIVGGGGDEQTSTLLFPTSAQMSVEPTAQGGAERSTVSAGQVLGTESAVGGAYTLSNGDGVTSAGGQGLSSIFDGIGLGGQGGTGTIPPGVVGTGASRSSQSENDFVVSAAGATFTVSPLENGVVGVGSDDVLTSGGPDLVRGSATLSLGSAGIVVAGVEETSTVQLPKAEPSPTGPGGILVPLDSQTLTALPTGSNDVILGEGTTLSAGGPAVTVGQQSLSLDSAGILIYGPDGTTTVPTSQYSTQTPDASNLLLTIGGQTIPASRIDPTAIALPDIQTTLNVGGEAATIANENITLEPSGLILASGTKTSTLPFHPKPSPSSPFVPVAVLTAVQTKYTVFSPFPSEETPGAAAVIIDNQTLPPDGRPLTLPNGAGTLRLLPSNTGIQVLDATRTTTLGFATAAAGGSTTRTGPREAVITVDGSTLTAYAPGSSNTAAATGADVVVVVGGVTLSPGGDALRVGDGTVSLGSEGLVVGSGDGLTTVPLTGGSASRTSSTQDTGRTSATTTSSTSSRGGEAEGSAGSLEPSATASSAATTERGWLAGWASGLLAVLVALLVTV